MYCILRKNFGSTEHKYITRNFRNTVIITKNFRNTV